MISQITNSVGYTPGDIGQPAPVVDVKPQKAAAPVEAPPQPDKAVDAATANKAADQINKVLKQLDSNLQFTVDDETSTRVVKVVDSATNEIIRQMPSQEMLAISKALDKLQGLLLRSKA